MKVKTLQKRLSKFDPEMDVYIMVAVENETRSDEPTSYDYLYTHDLKVANGYGMNKKAASKKMCIIYGDASEADYI